MKKTLLGLLVLTSLTLARADFTSYTLLSQSTALTYNPVVSYTFDSLSINFTGNSGGATNYTQDFSSNALVTLGFTSTDSIIGHSVQLQWFYPDSTSAYETFTSIIVPGTVFLGSGASDFVVTGDTITILNSTMGWTGAAFNGFVLTDLTRKEMGPSGSSTVPDSASTLPLLFGAMAGLVACRRGFRK